MRVVALIHLAPPRHNAGAEWMVVSMLRPLVARGHQVDILVTLPTPDTAPYDLCGITVHPLGTYDAAEVVAASDVVVTHLQSTPLASCLAVMYRKPVVQVMHNTFHGSKVFLRPGRVGLAVFNSEWMAQDFAFDGPSIIVRPPVVGDDYRTTPGDAVTLVNLSENKGAEVFWELAERMPDVPFVGRVGAYGEQIVRDLPNVTVLPHGDDMRDVYSRTKILLMPSVYESWGRVGVEAMHSGIPVVAHPTPGLRESLGAAGTFCDRANVDGWEAAVRRLLSPDAHKTASAAAVKRAGELDPTEDLRTWCEAVEGLVAA